MLVTTDELLCPTVIDSSGYPRGSEVVAVANAIVISMKAQLKISYNTVLFVRIFKLIIQFAQI